MIIYLLMYLVGWLFTYGLVFGYFQNKYYTLSEIRYRQDMGFAMLFAFLCPISTIVAIFMSGFGEYGFKFK